MKTKRRWIVWCAMALLGALLAAFAAPWLIRKSGTPGRLSGEASAPVVLPSDDEYRSENVRVQFRKPEPGEEEEKVPPSRGDGDLMY